MPYILSIAESAPIELHTDIPASRQGLIRPGAVAQYAEGPFGSLLQQHILTSDFSIHWNHYYIKQPIAFNYVFERPAVQVRMMLKGQERLHVPGVGDIDIGERQFYIIYAPGNTTPFTVSCDTESLSFTLELPISVVADLKESFPVLQDFIRQASRAVPSALFAQPGWITIEIEDLVAELLKSNLEVTLKNMRYGFIVRDLLIKLFLQKIYTGRLPITEEEFNSVQKARSIIESNVNSTPPTFQLAALAGIPEERLKAVFAEVVGMSIPAFIIAARLRYARHLLQYTDIPAKQISKTSGYTNQGNFSRAFKKVFGYTPNLIRKQSK